MKPSPNSTVCTSFCKFQDMHPRRISSMWHHLRFSATGKASRKLPCWCGFARLGDQQLQINSLSAMTLLDACEHPEQYPNLIIRVWGWSGYFCDLAPEYQDHIIQRCLYNAVG